MESVRVRLVVMLVIGLSGGVLVIRVLKSEGILTTKKSSISSPDFENVGEKGHSVPRLDNKQREWLEKLFDEWNGIQNMGEKDRDTNTISSSKDMGEKGHGTNNSKDMGEKDGGTNTINNSKDMGEKGHDTNNSKDMGEKDGGTNTINNSKEDAKAITHSPKLLHNSEGTPPPKKTETDKGETAADLERATNPGEKNATSPVKTKIGGWDWESPGAIILVVFPCVTLLLLINYGCFYCMCGRPTGKEVEDEKPVLLL